MAFNLVNALDALAPRLFENELVSIHKIASEDDIGYAVCECSLSAEQKNMVNPAGFSIARAWLNPQNNYPCIIKNSFGERVGFIMLCKWLADGEALSWSYYIDTRCQGRGYGSAAAKVAICVLKAACPSLPIKLSTEVANVRAQSLYTRLGFRFEGEYDGDDMVFILD